MRQNTRLCEPIWENQLIWMPYRSIYDIARALVARHSRTDEEELQFLDMLGLI